MDPFHFISFVESEKCNFNNDFVWSTYFTYIVKFTLALWLSATWKFNWIHLIKTMRHFYIWCISIYVPHLVLFLERCSDHTERFIHALHYFSNCIELNQQCNKQKVLPIVFTYIFSEWMTWHVGWGKMEHRMKTFSFFVNTIVRAK